MTLSCWIYKSPHKEEMYLYLAKENGFDVLPAILQKSFKSPELVMELELSTKRKLARADVAEVIDSLKSEGFYLQMPPKLAPDLHFGD